MTEPITLADISHFPKRPTGQSRDEYSGHESWSNEQWAWEFLRRNHMFQEWCGAVANDRTKKRNNVARNDYGLIKYKPFWEPYAADGVKPPRFTTRRIQSWSRVTSTQQRRFEKEISLPLRIGEVLVKFNIRAIEKSTKALARQLEAAKTLLDKREKQWKKRKRLSLKPGRNRNSHLVDLIRLLDLVEYNDQFLAPDKKQDRADLYQILFERFINKSRKVAPHERAGFGKTFQDKKEIADRYAATDYIDLAAAVNTK